jgi:hypothetical protein
MQGIVIQGPTSYYKQVISCYKDIPNVVWSTWEDEPKENIDFIKKYIPIITNKKPQIPGYLNINLQLVSTFSGINYLKNKGITEILKVRGDTTVTNLEIFLNKLKGKEMAFLAIAKEGIRKDIYYELVYPHYSHDYPVDLLIYGNIENMLNTFGTTIEDNIPIPPEAILSYNFLASKESDFILTYSHFIKNNVYFYLNDCIESNIQMIWLKNNQDIIQLHNSKQLYDF